MGFGNAIQKRVEELRKLGADVPKVIKDVQRTATILAVEKATEMTPPNNNTPLRGTNAISGDLKSRWAADSAVEPKVDGHKYTTILANNLQYASYVNDGHRMDMHFVPGLMINPHSGLLERVPRELGGIMVGTKTNYVKGLYMRQTAETTYRRVLEDGLAKIAKELSRE